MRGYAHQHPTRIAGSGPPDQAPFPPPPPGWKGPTLGEFVQQIEHEFGRQVDLSSLRLSGYARDEALDPSDIRSLCDLLGLPAEDFGVA